MIQAIHLVLYAAQALLRYAPSLALNVLFAILGTCVIIWTGYHTAALINRFFGIGVAKRDIADTVLLSYMTGAIYSLFIVYAAGGLGFYTPQVLWAMVLLPPLLRGPRQALRLPFPIANPGWKAAPFVLLGGGPLLVSLTNPMPSWMDALEANVAPIQRLITFSAFDASSALPSALYPVNRATPLYTSFFGLEGRLFGLEAHEILSASLLPIAFISMMAAYRLGTVLLPANRNAGWLAAFSWGLTLNYVQVQSARSTVWQMIFALIALAKIVELLREPGSFRLLAECAIACAAAILAHPFAGAFTVLTVLLLAGVALWLNRFQNTDRYLTAFMLGIAAGAPVLWTWWPDNRAALIGGLLLLVMIPVLLRRGAVSPETVARPARTSLPIVLRWAPMVIVLSTLVLKWDFYGEARTSFFLQELNRFPVPTGLTLAAIILAVSARFSLVALLAGASILAASLPLWVLPFIDLEPAAAESFRYEMPLKGMEYWLSSVLAICGSIVLAMIWSKSGEAGRGRAIALRVFVLSLLILPVRYLMGVHERSIHAAPGLYGMWKWHLSLAATGYWGGWADSRWIVGRSDREFFRFLRSRVQSGEIGIDDRIAHVARQSSLEASPFPAFTGITQDFYLPEVDTMHMHTRDGRIYDIDERRPPDGWILVERSMLPSHPVDSSEIVYQNRRLVLAHRPSLAREGAR